MSRKRILYTIPNFDTAGSGKALLNIATKLDPQKFEVHILCLHRKGVFFQEVVNSGLTVHVFNYLPKARPLHRMLSDCWRVSRKMKKINPAVIHSFHYSANYTEAIAAKMARIPWVFTKKNMNWGGASKNAWLLRSFLAKRIAVQNTDMIREFYPNSKKTHLIPRGVNVSHFETSEVRESIKTQLQTPIHDRVLITVANFVPVKGAEVLIRAFQQLHHAHPDWSLWLVGDASNSYGEELKTLVAEFDLADKIKFSGKQADIRPYLDHAEIFVLPTKNEGRKEGSPVSLLEAMANGKVVFGSDVPGIKDQLENFPDFIFSAGAIDDLATKLSKYMQLPPSKLQTIGAAFHEHVSLQYPIEKEVERHVALYNTITN